MNYLHILRRITAISILWVSFSAPTFAQAVRPVSMPVSWKDNHTLIIARQSGMKRSLSEYDIVTKAIKEIAMETKGAMLPKIPGLKASDMNPTLSPDSSRIAFTRDNDLYSIDIRTGVETRYTFDGSKVILNGRASWVYYEEIFGRKTQYSAFWWSPDSKRLAFYRFDDSKVPMFPIYHSDGQHGFIEETRYPMAGDPNPIVKVGIVPAAGGEVVWADFDPSVDQYFGTPYWTSGGKSLLVQWMDREQSNMTLYSVDPTTGSKNPLYKEYQKTWIEWIDEIRFGEKGFYFVRDFDLWEQIYFQSYDGKNLVKLTEGKNWATKIIDLDEKAGKIFYSSRCDSPVRNDLYAVTWNNKFEKRISKLSVGDFNYDGILLSPDKRHFVSVASNISTPHRLLLIATGKGGVVKPGEIRVIEDGKGTESEFAKLPATDMMFITTSDGYKLPASIIWPYNMDRSKKYPVLLSIYGGPNSPQVMDKWRTPGETSIRLAKAGVIQISIENRAAGYCGKEGENFIHRNLGKYEIQDFIEWAKHLRALPFVNGEKIGITGFSFGGTMTALALTDGAEFFKYGIAGGGVYDWMLYDSHYTERYMDHPKDNPEGYRSSSVLGKVNEYKSENGSLLYLTHGTGDDNVHMQNTMQLIDSLQKAGKHFELMLYPGGKHGYRGYQSQHSDKEEMEFWEKTLLK